MDIGVERFEKDRTRFKKTEIWNALYDFQKDCVVSAIRKLNTYGGCIIADSVGLGKTFEALAIIKYFQLYGWMLFRAFNLPMHSQKPCYRTLTSADVAVFCSFMGRLLIHNSLALQ